MTSLRDRMRENREAVTELLETQRRLIGEMRTTRDLLREVNSGLHSLRRSITWLRILGPLIILALGFVGGMGAGLLLR